MLWRRVFFVYVLVLVLVAVFVCLFLQIPIGVHRNVQDTRRTTPQSIDCLDDLWQRNKRRKSHLTVVCRDMKKHGNNRLRYATNVSQFTSFYVDRKYKIIYCEVPKVACTQWKRVLLMLTGQMNTSRLEDLPQYDVHRKFERHLRRLEYLPPAHVERSLNTYFKFMFVRHPFERIVSAYEDKFVSPLADTYQMGEGRYIIRTYRSNPTNESLARGHDVTFREFVRFLGDHWLGKNRWPLNSHWRPYTDLCFPCQVHYDVIGKYETLADDAGLVLDVITKTTDDGPLPAGAVFPQIRRRRDRTRAVLSRFDDVPPEDIRLLKQLYANDLRLFEYEYETRDDGTLSDYYAQDTDCIRRLDQSSGKDDVTDG